MKKFLQINRIFKLSFLICFFFLFKVSCDAASIFSSSTYSVQQNKSILLWKFPWRPSGIIWRSTNPDVATVDQNGIVCAKSTGSAEILANNPSGRTTSKCRIDVTQPEAIRSIFMNYPFLNEKEHPIISIMTSRKVDSIKIKLEGPNYHHEVHKQHKSNYHNCYFWQESFSPLKAGNYTASVLCHIDGQWKQVQNSSFKFTVSNWVIHSDTNTSRKSLSKEGADFIARKEGFVSHPYRDSAGHMTIGFGKLIRPFTPFYNNLTRDEAFQTFLNTVNNSGYLSAVNDMLINNHMKFNQYQLDALVSFTYNLGPGWTTKSHLKDLIINSGNENLPTYGVVHARGGLRLREAPQTNSKIRSVMNNGAEVVVLNTNKIDNKWYKVRTYDGKEGYCSSEFLNTMYVNKEFKNLNSISREKFMVEFLKYHHFRNRCLKGLLYRRIQELEIFFNGKYHAAVNVGKFPIPHCIKHL